MIEIDQHSLCAWGWDQVWADIWSIEGESETVPGRIISETRGAYDVVSDQGVYRATPIGRLRKQDALPWPAVGDWVSLRLHSGGAQMTKILPRRTCLRRKAAGSSEDIQILATNIDRVLIVTSVNQDFNIRRLERFSVAARDSGAAVSLVLSKVDLTNSPAESRDFLLEIKRRFGDELDILQTSTVTKTGLTRLRELCAQPGVTSVFLGTSGVGKSSLVNFLLGDNVQDTGHIRIDDSKGRHTTAGRSAFQILGGGVIIDTPGIRELQLRVDDAVDQEFSDIEELRLHCKFSDCTHKQERGCSVQGALADGSLTQDRLDSYLKLQAETKRRADQGRRR